MSDPFADADLVACAQIVERGDPDRFAATMAAPVPARPVLFPLYAFNMEIARAPWVTNEPLIAQMRLQWWQDALEEIAGGGPVRRHEVATPLAGVLDAEGARILLACVQARHRDAARERPKSAEDLQAYLAETGGALMWAAARALGSTQEGRARAVGQAAGLANYLLGVPEFLARGLNPLPEMSDAQWQALIDDALALPAGRPCAPSGSRSWLRGGRPRCCDGRARIRTRCRRVASRNRRHCAGCGF